MVQFLLFILSFLIFVNAVYATELHVQSSVVIKNETSNDIEIFQFFKLMIFSLVVYSYSTYTSNCFSLNCSATRPINDTKPIINTLIKA